MRRRWVCGGLLAGFASFALAAPSSVGLVSEAAAAEETLVLFVKNVTNPFWKSVRVGADKAADELGVTLEHAAPTKPDNIEEQTRLVEDWIVRKPDAMVFVPVDYQALVPTVQKVNAAGIPLVNFNNRMTDIEMVTYVGSDDETIGYEISKHLFEALGGEGKVVHIDGVPAAITAQNRKKGMERALQEYPGIELIASQPGNYRRLPAVQVFENLMQAHPVIDGVIAANDDMAVGVVEALEAAGRGGQTLVVGIDAIPDGAAKIEEGGMLATADFSGHDQGYLAVKAAVKHLRGEPVPEQIMLPVVIVTEDNVEPWLGPVEDRKVPDWDAVVAEQAKS